MKIKYFSYAQAYAIAKDHQYLCGQSIACSSPISIITPAPYSRILQWQFARKLLEGHPADALLMDVADGRFDVVAITRTQNPEIPFIVTDLRSLLDTNNASFDLSPYRCLRSFKAPFAEVRSLLDR